MKNNSLVLSDRSGVPEEHVEEAMGERAASVALEMPAYWRFSENRRAAGVKRGQCETRRQTVCSESGRSSAGKPKSLSELEDCVSQIPDPELFILLKFLVLL